MSFAYVVKKGREFRLPGGGRFKTGDLILGDKVAELEKEGHEHLLHHVIRIQAPVSHEPLPEASKAS